MKTRKFLAYGLIAFATLTISCSKDESPEGDEYSTLSIEDNKAKMEDDGIKMIGELEGLEKEPAVETSKSLVTFLNKGDKKMASLTNTAVFTAIYAAQNIGNGQDALKSIQVDDPANTEISDNYNDMVGVYNWNSSEEKWDKGDKSSFIIFNFPSTENGTVNNASYTISYTGKVGQLYDYNGDLPMEVSTSLKVNNKEISSLYMLIAYNSDNIPTREELTFKIGSYKIYSLTDNANNSKFNHVESFTHGSKIIYKFTFDAAGDWSVKNIENLEQDGDISKVVTKGNTSLQVMNIKVVGAVDVKNFMAAANKENLTIDEQIAAVNKNITLNVRYANDNKIIAKAEAYSADGQFDTRFVFADGSKESAEKYASKGFDRFINKINTYSQHLEEVYGGGVQE